MDDLKRKEKLHSPAFIKDCEDNGALCTLIFIFPASRDGQELIWRENGNKGGENGELVK